MMICPRCGRYMTFSMTYVSGSPVVIWRCVCGYDSSKERVITTNRTEILNSNILHVIDQNKC